MPPSVPSGAKNIAPALVRTLATAPPAPSQPSKAHHVLSYPSDAFPQGYAVSSTHCGIKKTGAQDLGILVSTSTRPMSAASCMTRNVFKAAPVTVSADLLHSGKGRARGFIVNSGCANAVTGKKGLEDAWTMSKSLTDLLPKGEHGQGSLVMSTGVIGQLLPIDRITKSIPSLHSNLDNSADAWTGLAKAFMTTDTFPKLRARTFQLGGKTYKMAGIDKGAGMIAPNMGAPPSPPHATLLGVIATDAAVEPASLQKALEYAVDRSFNSITVDGDMSTNDTILAFANAAAAGESQEISEKGNPKEFEAFKEELRDFAEELAQLVVRDGEGATKFVTVRVKSAPSYEVANAVAKSVASSSLVKTAMYGEEYEANRANFSGYTALPQNASINPTSVSVSFHPPASAANPAPIRLLTNGEPEPNIDEDRASEILKEEDLEVVVDLGNGTEEARVWTCDFSHEYVTINGSYRS